MKGPLILQTLNLALAILFAIVAGEEDVVVLTEANFEKEVGQDRGALVGFYAPGALHRRSTSHRRPNHGNPILHQLKILYEKKEEPVSRTISLCTGMQSSTLAGLLATQFLGSSHAVPAACSVVAMAIMGLSLASFWGNGSRIRDIPVPSSSSSENTADANS